MNSNPDCAGEEAFDCIKRTALKKKEKELHFMANQTEKGVAQSQSFSEGTSTAWVQSHQGR